MILNAVEDFELCHKLVKELQKRYVMLDGMYPIDYEGETYIVAFFEGCIYECSVVRMEV